MENFPIATSIEANIIDLLISQQKENETLYLWHSNFFPMISEIFKLNRDIQ